LFATFVSEFEDRNGKKKQVRVVFNARQAKFVSYTAIPDKQCPKVEGMVIYKKKEES